MRISLLLTALLALPCLAVGLSTPPGLDKEGLEGWQKYQKATAHRAFVVAPGGAWAWQEGLPSATAAQQMALSACQQQTSSPCLVFDLDGKPQLDAANWAASLAARYSPSANPTTGIAVGQRFPDLMLADKSLPSLSSLRGKIVVLHFWGSWCPPCAAEIPEFAQLAHKLRQDERIHILALPAFETAKTAREWLDASDIDLKVTALSSAGPQQVKLRNPNQGSHEIPLRNLAPALPSSYILDRNGIVLLRHAGPIPDWNALLPILRHAAQQ